MTKDKVMAYYLRIIRSKHSTTTSMKGQLVRDLIQILHSYIKTDDDALKIINKLLS